MPLKTRRQQVNGLTFFLQEQGSGPPVLLLHGFTGSSADWLPFFPLLAPFYRVLAVDLIGHGRSAAPARAERYSMESCIDDLLALLAALQLPAVAVVGYSMGGRTALHLTAAAPERVKALCLESTSPGLARAEDRHRRRLADAELAAFIEDRGLPAFVRRWEELPLFASQKLLAPALQARLRRGRLENRPHGLANSLRGMGTGSMAPLHGRLGSFNMPALVMAGERDEKYVAAARAMARALPRAELAIVPEAGHNIHLEQPEKFGSSLLDFLQRHYPAARKI